ncbi:MAG: FKBP-type peptidyl-prolyl cis-trans isomerase [Bacteroides sp.]|nr:FKBP-type peptidyl-prolyl cis-trans isomerase [Roseburia sp.]MCM1346475.1 FKBP-type peptidyl-prolyl cis-trans isomerase [Bacteroides sp.]MCM1420345.1 FKBP-type peptidyl-prolyl cis-trans isomerase [Bacteroides sp.]
MKKLGILAAAAIAAASFTACQHELKADLNGEVDSIAYDLGVAQAQSLKQYMTMQLGVDSAYIDEFIKGMQEGAVSEEIDKKKQAYMKGLEVGNQVQNMAKGLTKDVYADDTTKNVNVKNLLAGLVAGMKGNAEKTSEEAYTSFNTKLQAIHDKNNEAKYGDNKKKGEEYLAANKKKDGVKTTESGLQYKVLTEGTGVLPNDSSVISVKYEGKLIDGTVFDSTEKNGGKPFEVNMKYPRVIQGWVEALKLMPAGSKWEVCIPYNLAYGTQDMGQIKPFSTLVFTIEVVDIK